MSTTVTLLENLLLRIDATIKKHPTSDVAAVDTKQLTPAKFVEKYLLKELTILQRFSESHIEDMLEVFLNRTDSLIKSVLGLKEKEPIDFSVVNSICIYYTLMGEFLNSREITQNEEVAEDELCQKIIHQSMDIFSTDFGKYDNFVDHHLSFFLSAVGSHSKNIYGFFMQKLETEVETASLKQLKLMLRPWVYMQSSVKNVFYSLNPISQNLSRVHKQCREPFCDTINDTVLMALKKDIKGFVEFLDQDDETESAQRILETIITWNEKTNSFTWPTQLILEILVPSKLDTISFDDPKSFHSKLKKFNKGSKSEIATTTLFYGFRALALSNCHAKLDTFMNNFYDAFFNEFISGKREYKDEVIKMAYIDFPMCVLMKKPNDFNEKIIPIIMNEKTPELWTYMASIIRRVCKQTSFLSESNPSYIENLIEPTFNLLKLSESNPAFSAQCIPHLISAFQYSPSFFKLVITKKKEFLTSFINIIKTNQTFTPQKALLELFNQKYVEETNLDDNFYELLLTILQFLTETYKNVALYKSNNFADQIHEITLNIARFLRQVMESKGDENIQINNSVISYLEASAITYFASSKKEIRYCGVSIIEELILIINLKPEQFAETTFPLSDYEQLVASARRAPILTTAHRSIKDGLRTVSEVTDGMADAFDILFPYFLALTKAINPNITLVQQPTIEVERDPSILQEEWIGVISILFAIVWKQFITLSAQFKILLGDDGDLGAMIVSAVPTSFATRHFNAMIALSLNWIAHCQNQSGFFETNEKNTVFIGNIIKMIRGLTEQNQWTQALINPEIFGKLLSKMVSYCDLVPGETLRLPCAQCILSVTKLLNKFSKSIDPSIRHQISKSLFGWIPTVSGVSKQYIHHIHQALALTLDDLNLLDCIDPNDPKSPEEQAKNQFMLYFASIKNKLDLSDTDVSYLIPVLTALLKKNLEIGIEQCISMGFDEKDNVRAAFISAIAAVFKVPEVKVVDEEQTTATSLIDYIFTGDWDYVDFICSCVPYSRAEAFGAAMVEASVIRGIEYDYLTKMIASEVATVDEGSKNTLFRGNAVPARAVGHFPRLVGSEWMTNTLRPIFEEVIQKCENGVDYQVDPRKLRGGNLEQNQKNFRDLLNQCIDAILNSIESMPVSLIIESKLIYEKVSDKYGDFAIQILSGFLFLRFLLPAFSVPKLVGLPDMLPTAPRTALLAVSTVLMAATLRGQLNEKGEHLIPFNDIAKRANEVFKKMFLDIVNTETEIEYVRDKIKLNEETEIKAIHAELYPLLPQINNSIAEMADDNPIKVQTLNLITELQALGEPVNTKKPRRATISVHEEDGDAAVQKQLEELLTMEFTEDQIQELHDFIVRDENTAPDGSTILYAFFDKLKNIKDIRIVPHLYIKAIHDEVSTSITMVNIFHDFDESKVPIASEIEIFAKMKPMRKVKKYVCLQLSNSCISWLTNNPKIIQSNKFHFVKQLSEYVELLGTPSKQLPQRTLESLTRPDTHHKAIVNGLNCIVRIHQHSLQIVGDETIVNNYKLTPINVILADEIIKISKPKQSQTDPKDVDFKLSTNSMTYSITVSMNSPLYDNISQIYIRVMTLKNIANESKVKVNNSTLQWLMLNIAFVNIVNGKVSPTVHKAAIDLIYSAYASFEFKRTINVTKTTVDTLPDCLIGYSQLLSEDLAENNPDAYIGFLTEYFNTYKYIDDFKSTTFIYMEPWIKLYAQNIDKCSKFTEKIFEIFTELSNNSIAFTKSIWPPIIKSSHAAEIYLNKAYQSQKEVFIGMICDFAAIDSKLVSHFWSYDVFQKAFENYDDSIIFICKTLSTLFTDRLFDFDCIPQIIYNFATLRIHYSEKILSQCALAFTNAIHFIICKSGSSLPIDLTNLANIFSVVPKIDDSFENGNQNEWVESTTKIAFAIKAALSGMNNSKISDEITTLFTEDFSSEERFKKAQAIIFMSAFEQNHDLIETLIGLTSSDDPLIINIICSALQLIEFTQEDASKFFMFGIVSLLTFLSPSSVGLIGYSLYQFSKYDKYKNIIKPVSDEIMTYIGTTIGDDDFSSNPFDSVLILAAIHCSQNIKYFVENINKAKIKTPLAKLFGLLLSDKYLSEKDIYDFGENNATVNATLCLLLKRIPSEYLIKYLTKRIEIEPEAFQAFKIFNSQNSSEFLRNVSNPHFLSLLIRTSRFESEKYSLAPILLPSYNPGMEHVKLTIEQYEYLRNEIFKL